VRRASQNSSTSPERVAATTDHALDYLRERTAAPGDAPFLLYVGYMHPHFPLVAPPEFAAWYDPARVTPPPTWQDPPQQQHPVIARLRHGFHNDEPLSPEQVRRATASYWALVSHLDFQVGRLLAAIDGSPMRENIVVVYTSDHGEMAGHHGIWQKQCFYEPAVRVPLLLRLPEHRDGRRVPARVPGDVSLVDLLPTLRDVAGLPVDPELPGRSLCGPDLPPRPAFAEYHAQGMIDGGFMLTRGRYKYCATSGTARSCSTWSPTRGSARTWPATPPTPTCSRSSPDSWSGSCPPRSRTGGPRPTSGAAARGEDRGRHWPGRRGDEFRPRARSRGCPRGSADRAEQDHHS
jgi:arylsulfatase A-like enzyme